LPTEANTESEYLRYIVDTTDKKTILHNLMTQYGNDVWNFAFSMTRKWEVADDITQDVFLKAYRHLHTFRSDSSLKTWLLAIARNTIKDYHKAAFIRKVTLVDFVQTKDARPSAEQEVIERFAVNEIWKQVLELPAKYREVLILYGHYQLSMKEIAQLLGVREGTVKSRLHQARLKIVQMRDRAEHERN
jgi:RNA polymerase sigma factor, sigma-70 family